MVSSSKCDDNLSLVIIISTSRDMRTTFLHHIFVKMMAMSMFATENCYVDS